MKFTNTLNIGLLCIFCHFTAVTCSICKKRNILDLLLLKFCWLRPNCRLLKIINFWDGAMWSGTNVLTFCCNLQGRKISDVPISEAYRKNGEKPQVVVMSFLTPVGSLTTPIQWTITPHAAYSSGLNMEIANSSKQFIPPYGITSQKATIPMVTTVSTSHFNSITSETL